MREIEEELIKYYCTYKEGSYPIKIQRKVHDLKKNRAHFILLEEERLKLKCQAIWLDLGDQNTKFFHQFDNDRHAQNTIWEIKGDGAEVVSEPGKIKIESVRHFHNLFLDPCNSFIVYQMHII